MVNDQNGQWSKWPQRLSDYPKSGFIRIHGPQSRSQNHPEFAIDASKQAIKIPWFGRKSPKIGLRSPWIGRKDINIGLRKILEMSQKRPKRTQTPQDYPKSGIIRLHRPHNRSQILGNLPKMPQKSPKEAQKPQDYPNISLQKAQKGPKQAQKPQDYPNIRLH